MPVAQAVFMIVAAVGSAYLTMRRPEADLQEFLNRGFRNSVQRPFDHLDRFANGDLAVQDGELGK